MTASAPPSRDGRQIRRGPGQDISAFKPLLLCFSHLRWDYVWQRPQHLISRAAQHYRVVFLEEPLYGEVAVPEMSATRRWAVTVATPILPNAMQGQGALITSAMRSLVDELVAGNPSPERIFWYYTPMALAFSRQIVPDLCVYDNMDELSAFHAAPPELLALESELFQRADLVFTGGQSLFESKRDRHPDVHGFPSSVDAAHFQVARRHRSDPADQASIARPRFGFFGVIDERMDLDLVRSAAEMRPGWNFILIGPTAKIDPSMLPQRPNLHWLGPKQYAELPSYLAGWDVGFMPFALNEATRFISPTKTPEFLAAGVPVVSTPILDVVRPYGEKALVAIAQSAEEFVKAGERILQTGRSPAWLRRVDRHLAAMSWDKTWDAMHHLMRERLQAEPTQEEFERDEIQRPGISAVAS